MGKDSEGFKFGGQPLTDDQRRLVRENMGLVSVHLQRFVQGLGAPRRDREWDDLFQEGCLGLMRAAIGHREDSGIPFAAFALARIHNAVSRALARRFSLVYVPQKRKPARQEAGDDRAAPRVPRVHSLSEEQERSLRDPRRHDPISSGVETVGERLHRKYDRALGEAGRRVSAGQSRRGDRAKLVDVLLEERHRVPSEDARTALRQIARQTESSYARVAQCDKQLIQAVRDTLEADPEFVELRRRARTSPDGTSLGIDSAFERELATLSADAFVDRYHQGTVGERTEMLRTLLEVSDSDLDDVLRKHVATLMTPQRERLLQQSPASSDTGRGGKSKAAASTSGGSAARSN